MTRCPDQLDKGQAAPLGALFDGSGVNFSLFSAHAEKVELCVFDGAGAREVRRFPLPERTGDVWHGYLDGAGPGLLYGYRVHGPYDPARGHRFNANKLLIDPYAKSLSGRLVFDAANFGYRRGDPAKDLSFDDGDNAAFVPKCEVVKPYDNRSSSTRPKIPWADTILYELHLRGYTKRHPDIAAALRGTFAGLATAPVIDHLLDLGVTSVELLPVHALADERHLAKRGLTNYWGYNSFNFFCPEPRYLATGVEAEVRQAVDAFHAAGIEVIVDVVYNHTGEGDELGPTLSFRGIDNAAYYHLAEDLRSYVNHSGCGNTLNMAQPQVRQMIVDSLAHWADRFDVDGFRFDLAVALGRNPDQFDTHAPLFRAIREHPSLAGLKLIAEPWDIGPDGHQTGNFPVGWAEWNDRYRDCVRRVWRGDAGMLGEFATRIAGSSDLFDGTERGPLASVNLVASHDGFTLQDLVSYSQKHNDANGEGNRDGTDENFSWNCGTEGSSAASQVLGLRRRQKRNLLATLLLSQGVPMLLAGDEFGRTQAGNNNAYCQDNELSWVDWSTRTAEDLDLTTFVKTLIRLRRDHTALRRATHFTGEPIGHNEEKDITWLHPRGHEMTIEDWGSEHGRILGLHLPGRGEDEGNLLILINAGARRARFVLPGRFCDQSWRSLIDTMQDRPGAGAWLAPGNIWLEPHSLLLAVHGEEDAPLFELADRTGIARDYWDIEGGHHRTTAATACAVLAAMGIAAQSPAEVEGSLKVFDDRKWRDPLPPVMVVQSGAIICIPVTADRSAFVRPLTWKIVTEDGAQFGGEEVSADLPITNAAQIDGRYWERRSLTIRPRLPFGYHQAVLSGAVEATMPLIVAPARCYLPLLIEEDRKLWGLTLQLYALRSASNWGLGDFRDLAELAAWAGRRGAATIVLNPLHALFPGHPECASPYFPSSRSFLNPLYLSPRDIPDFAECTEARDQIADPAVTARIESLRRRDWIDYSGVAAVKYDVLRRLYASFHRHRIENADDDRSRAFRRFEDKKGKALQDFAVFETLAARFGTSVQTDWPDEFRSPDSPAVAEFVRTHPDDITFRAYLQWQAEVQLGQAAKMAEEAGLVLGLCRDLAVGCSIHGADGWRYQSLYTDQARLGAPPDPFNPSGQDWGIAPMNPHALRALAYAPFIELLRANMHHAGVLRIDHVMAIARQFWVPAGAGPQGGTYVRYPMDDLLGILALESQRNRCMIIGEDLGTVPEGFRERMTAAGVLSCRVLYFEQDADTFRRPGDYPHLAAACLSTHDLPTLKGYWRGTDLEEKRQLGLYPSIEVQHQVEDGRIKDKAALLSALQEQGLLDTEAYGEVEWTSVLWDAAHRFLAGSGSALVLIQLDDLVDEDVQINVPGTSDHERLNWRRRLRFNLEYMKTNAAVQDRLTMIDRTRRAVTPPA